MASQPMAALPMHDAVYSSPRTRFYLAHVRQDRQLKRGFAHYCALSCGNQGQTSRSRVIQTGIQFLMLGMNSMSRT